MTPNQCRAARGLLGINQRELCADAGVGRLTLQQFESGRRETWEENVAKLRAELERRGVTFGKTGHSVKVKVAEKRRLKTAQ